MPILASSMYVNAYGKAAGLVAVTGAPALDSINAGEDAYIVKYDSAGKSIWSARVGSTDIEIGYDIATDPSGNVYVTGQSGPGGPVTVYNSDGSPFGTPFPNISGEAFVVKYDTIGSVMWVARLSSAGQDIGFGIATDSAGNVYVTGSGASTPLTAFSSNGVAFGTTRTMSSGDAFIVKYNTIGIVQWLARVNSTGVDIGYGLTTDLSGNAYVTGQGGSGVAFTARSFDDSAFGTAFTNRGGTDTFIAKYNTSGLGQWVAQIASASADLGYAAATDLDGNLCVTGQYIGTLTARSSNGSAFGTTLPSSAGDAFVVKYDTSGIVQWVARVVSSAVDIGYGIATDLDRNVYVTGQGGLNVAITAFSSNGIVFGTTLPNSGSNDTFLVKYNTGGFVQWLAKIASSGLDTGFSVATDSSGNVYVTGWGGVGAVVTAFSSNGDAFGRTIANSGGSDTFLVKYNTSGIVQWVTRLASGGTDAGRALAIDSTNNIYTTGSFSGSRFALYGQGISLFSSLSNSGGTDAFIIKYNTNGAPQWTARVASTGSDIGYDIATDSGGNIYVTGQGGAGVTMTIFSSNEVAFGTVLASSGQNEAFVVKYNTSGIAQWVARVSSPSVDASFSIATDLSGNAYVTGQGGSASVITARSSDGFAFDTTLPNSGSTDAFIVKYNTNGIVQWVARVASTGQDIGYGIATDSARNVYVTGQGGSNAVISAFSSDGAAFGTTLPNTSGSNDAFLVKYNTNGFVQWVARVASSQSDIGYAITTDLSGNVYITGQCGSGVITTAFSSNGVAFGTTIPATAGGSDIFVVKYDTNGIVQWVARIVSPITDIGFAIATDSARNVYVSGYCGGTTATAFSSDGVAFSNLLISSGNVDVFIVKYNTNGFVQWVARVGSTVGEFAYGIATDSSGSVYVTGNANTTVTVINSDTTVFSTMYVTGVFVIKYDTNGYAKWIQVARGASLAGGGVGRGITTDSFGNAYVTGSTASGQPLQLFNIDLTPYLFANTTIGADALVVKYSSNASPQWVARISSTLQDAGNGIATDSAGNVYVTGRGGIGAVVTAFSSNGATFGTTLPNSGNTDVFIVKYNTSGFVQWLARVASTGEDIGYGTAIDPSGNVFVAGQGGAATVTAFSSDGAAFGTTLPSSAGDAFVVKYNTSGFVQWLARVASAGVDFGQAIVSDVSGNAYIAGYGGSGVGITAYSSNGVAFGTTLPNSGLEDTFLVKYDTSGSVQWIARVASTARDIGYAIATDSARNVYVTGQSGGGGITTAFSSNGVAFGTTLPDSGNPDAFLVKYSTDGFVQWVARIASTSGSEIGYGITTDSGGNVYVVGTSDGTSVTAFSSNGSSGGSLSNSGSNDAFLVKYNSSGIVQWITRMGSESADFAFSVTTDSAGNVYVTGRGGAVVAFSTSDAPLGSSGAPSSGAFVVKYNSTGVAQWIASMSGGGNGIAIDSLSNLYITGSFVASGLVPYSTA